MSKVATKTDSTKAKIVRALQCAAGEHEPWIRTNVWNGGTDTVHVSMGSDMHDEVHFCVCKHCRCPYVRRRDE